MDEFAAFVVRPKRRVPSDIAALHRKIRTATGIVLQSLRSAGALESEIEVI